MFGGILSKNYWLLYLFHHEKLLHVSRVRPDADKMAAAH